MSRVTAAHAAAESQAVDAPKRRRCLRCSEAFMSSWSGERVCTRCKSSNAWRSGEAFRSHPASGRR